VVHTRGGDDRVRAALEARGLILVPLVANVLGGTGNDQVLIDTQNSVASWSWSALADGGPGNDSLQAMGLTGAMLLGGDGDDQTLGGGGRDVLIGGRGRDMMSAGGEQDLIVPAFTAFDANPDAVRSIHASWNGNHPFLERVEFLSGPSDAPFHLSVGESVFDDGLDNDIADPALDDWLILPCFVTNTNDSGPGSLRDAIICANEAALPGQAAVAFRIPTSDPGFVDVDSAMPGGDSDPDVFVINPVSELSPMDNEHGWGIVLDGRSQARFGGDTNLFGPEIVLDGFSGITEPVIESGLRLFSDDNRVFGLNVQRFADLGIQIEGSRNWVAGNYIGTDATGMIARSNGHGVEVLFADWNCIGTNGDGLADEAERNLISGNGTGVSILSANDNAVAGNFIGTTRDGEHALGNFQGVITSHGLRNRIGTDGNGVADQVERNVISANRTRGVWIVEGSSNIVAGNYIGTDVTGRNDLGNGEAGVEIQSSDSNRIGTDGNRVADEDERNLISGNLLGIDIHEVFGPGARNVVAGNYIGTDVTGTASIENDFVGVFLMGAENRIGTNGDGIADAAVGNLISGNRINGVMIVGAESVRNVLAGNRIGTDVNGTAALGNKQDGVAILGGARSNRIGTNADGAFDAAERNIISGNALRGVHIAGVGTDENRVAGNHIGTDVTGTVDLGNGGHGVLIFESAAGNLIGGTSDAARNIISGNDNDGIRIQNAAIGNRVEGNFIGTDVTGTHALGNNGIESDGVAIVEAPRNVVGGSEPGAGNVISSNTLNGVGLQGSAATDNLVLGNRIGTDATGTKPLGNFGYGVVINVASNNVIGGVGPGERNIISANRAGVFIGSDLLPGESVGNRVLANFIGADVTGRAPLGNGANGVEIFFRARNNVVDRNVVAGNRENGIVILGPDATNNAVVNNYVGIDADGNAAIGNRNTGVQITGSAHHNLVHSNVLSGNGNAGLDLFAGASNNLVTRNYVGLNVSGTAAIPNKYGVAVQSAAERNTIGTNGDGVDDASEGNVISSNHADGVLIGGGTFNVVAGNTITNNAGYGVHVLDGAVANRIGTDGTNVLADSVEGNHIAGNALDGVRVVGASTVRNSIRGNSIHSNGLLGIDLGGDGVTANDLRDPDTGPNALQNYPSQLTAINGVTGTRVFGLLMSVPGQQFAIDFYASNVADPSGFGEGRRWLGTRFVSTNGVGVAIINHTLDESALPGEFLTATATDKLGNTSEFSRAVRVIGTAASMAPATPTLFVAASAEALPRAVSGAANRLHATGSNRRRLVPMKVADSRRAARGPASGRTVPIEFDTGGWRGSMAANDPASWLGMPDQASSKPGSGNSCGGLSES
jgi:Right handed beta helix region